MVNVNIRIRRCGLRRFRIRLTIILLQKSTKITQHPIVKAGLTAAVTANVGHIPKSSRKTGFSRHNPANSVCEYRADLASLLFDMADDPFRLHLFFDLGDGITHDLNNGFAAHGRAGDSDDLRIDRRRLTYANKLERLCRRPLELVAIVIIFDLIAKAGGFITRKNVEARNFLKIRINGDDQFSYKANDGALNSNVATVRITVDPVNDAPAAADDAYSVDEDNVLTVATPGVLGNDTDVDEDALTAVLVGGPSDGTLTLNVNGSFSYTPGGGRPRGAAGPFPG